MSRLWLCIAFVVCAACHGQKEAPELHVLGAQREVVFVQVTNPASHPMRLSKLDYTFAADNGRTKVAQGEIPLDEREVPAQSAVVVEVPLDADVASTKPMTLTGTLTAELDEIVRSFQVKAQVQPH